MRGELPTDASIPLVIAAMRNLRPSGKQSFEQLVAQLLSKVSGQRIRLCKAGSQGGVDALAEIAIGIECKRYTTNISGRDLRGGLTEAAETYPDLQLWVLTATCEVAAQTYQALKSAGGDLGIGVLILDTASTEPELRGVGGLVALAATDIEMVLAALAGPSSRDGAVPDLAAIERELSEVRGLPEFGAWVEHLRTELRDMPIWRRFVHEQNRDLLALLKTYASRAFGTPYEPGTAVPRSIEVEISKWVESRVTGKTDTIAVITGERYDGKTWLVYRWLSENLVTLPVPVFFFSSRAVQDARGDLESLILKQIRENLGIPERRATQLLDRQRFRRDGEGWGLIVLDGLNEYVPDRDAFVTAVRWALPIENRPIDPDQNVLDTDGAVAKRGCALLVTCRTRDFDDDQSLLQPWPISRIRLGPYNDTEFANALEQYDLAPSDLVDLSESASNMIRHPRYLDLMVHHRKELGQFSVITADVLHYLDASDKIRAHGSSNPNSFKEILTSLAQAWSSEQRLNSQTLRKQLREVTDSVEVAIAALRSEGVLTPQSDGSWMPDPERLALGMGLFIRERLAQIDTSAFENELANLLEPHRDDDEKVRWLRAAVTTSLMVGDTGRYPEMFDFLLKAWLTARNFSEHDLGDVKSLSPLLVEPILRLVSEDVIAPGILVLAQAMVESESPRNPEAIANAIRRWFRLVPLDDPWHSDDERAHVAEVIRAAADPSLRDLELRTTAAQAGQSVRKRHRFGLSILLAHPSLVPPVDLLALVAARGISQWELGDGERYALRVLLANVDRAWFENEIRSSASNPESSRSTFLHHLTYLSRRSELIDTLPSTARAYQVRESELMRSNSLTFDDAQDADAILREAGRAASHARDPFRPPPPREWLASLSTAARARFGAIGNLHAGRCQTRDDLDFEQAEPALAAWAPEDGAAIVHSFLRDIPRRIAAGEESWSWAIEDNAALLTAADRRKLLEFISATPASRDGFGHALRRAYLCVVASAPLSQRLPLLLDHPFIDFEWTKFYEVFAIGADERLRKSVAAAVRKEIDRRRLKRARYLLAQLGGWEPSTTDLMRLISDLTDTDDDGQHAARTLLRTSRIPTDTPASVLRPLVQVASTLVEEAWQYVAFSDIARTPSRRGAEWIARARSAPMTARSRGAEATDDNEAVRAGIEHFAARVEASLIRQVRNTEHLPDGIAAEVGDAAFDRWVARLLESEGRRILLDPGVLVAVMRHALQTKHNATKELWELAYPFDRRRISLQQRFVKQGLDWTLSELHDPAIDDSLACELLEGLVRDCRSNTEMVSVAMGARIASISRLTRVVDKLLDDRDDAVRARARFITGWLPENAVLRQRIAMPDPSEWVCLVGEAAIKRLDRERNAREWLGRFLAAKNRTRRWAAGRLFIACSDAATPFWAYDVIQNAAACEWCSEAALLVDKIRNKVDDSEFRDSFLRYSVRSLSEVIPPWRRSIRWDEITITSDEDV